MGWFKSLGISLACFCVANAATVSNPIIWADVPDVSTTRVDDTYYMVSTTMHFAPGVPVMKSTDLANWRTVGYAYQTLTNNDNQNLENGKDAYGKGSWASSIRYHKGFFYVLTPSYTTGKTHLYKTDDVESGNWSEVQLPFYHDPSLFFDDDGSVFVIYGGGEISYVELNSDASGVKQGGKSGKLNGVNAETAAGTSNFIVKQEGLQMFKVNGEYYLFTISWPSGKCRTELVYRSKTLLGEYTGKIFLQNNGVAQGGIFDTPEGNWYAMLFRDSGPVGRIPYLVPMKWENGWPVAENGSAPETLNLPNETAVGYNLVTSDDFTSDALALEWQWNHNPDNKNWSLKANPGNLRITTSRVDSRIVTAKNTLTQRTFGPKCSGRILLDGAHMKDGDIAGLVALQDKKGFVGLTKENGNYKVVMFEGDKDSESQKASAPFASSKIYLRIDFDLPRDKGTASFYYSENGNSWTKIGSDVSLEYSLGMFVGYRFGLFNYATKTAGGYVDFDWFKIGRNVSEEIYLDDEEPIPQTAHNATQTPWAIPGKIEMEDFDDPGKGKDAQSYSESDAENHGDSDYREGTGVDLYKKATGIIVGYNAEGEWLEYTVNVKKAGDYTLFVAVAAAGSTSSFKFSLDSDDITEEIAVPAAKEGEENYDEYNKVKANVTLPEGIHILRFTVMGAWLDIDYITFVSGKDAVDPEPIEKPSAIAKIHMQATGVQKYRVFSLNGNLLGTIFSDGVNLVQSTRNLVGERGVYIVKPSRGGMLQRITISK